jgi:hypothetical protein
MFLGFILFANLSKRYTKVFTKLSAMPLLCGFFTDVTAARVELSLLAAKVLLNRSAQNDLMAGMEQISNTEAEARSFTKEWA